MHPLVYDLIKDFHPLRWTSKYRRTTVPYLIIMFLFYSAIHLIVVVAALLLIQLTDYNFNANLSFYAANYNIAAGLAAGPMEETLYFGIPLYATGNHIVVMATGILWAMIHLPNTSTVQLNALAYPQFFGLIPSIFLSFRTWISGKGWFAIVSHSIWDIAVITPLCISGELSCNSSDQIDSIIGSIIIASTLTLLTYFLYRRRVKKLKYKIAIMTVVFIYIILTFVLAIYFAR